MLTRPHGQGFPRKGVPVQQRPPSPEPHGDHDPLTPGLPRSVKPIQTIVWVFITIGAVGLILAIIFAATR